MSTVSSTTSTTSTASTASTSSSSKITFSGLASGVDTASVVSSIIKAESAPITTMENKETYLKTELETYQEFNTLLESFASSLDKLNNASDLKSYTASNNGSDYFSITTNSLATEGTHSVKVSSLAQQQKDVSSDAIADTSTTTLTGELKIGDNTLSYDSTTLSDLVDKINAGDYGMTASAINDGTGAGYRLMLTADTAGTAVAITGTGSITLDTATNGHTVTGTKAHVVVDGVDYYGTSNTMTNAIKGASLNLLGESTAANNVTIKSDAETVIATQLQELVTAYNAINTSVKTITASDAALGRSMKSVQNGLKDYLTSKSLVSLGISSDWQTGALSFDSSTCSTAYTAGSDAVKVALVGDDTNTGIMTRLNTYLTDQLDSSSGFLVTKKSSINKETARLDDSIAAFKTRMEKRQTTLETQFTAMETMVSSLNSQSTYLTNFFKTYNTSS